MKLPRDLSGTALAKALGRIGYRVSRQTGSHIRLTADMPTQHHVTIPAHDPLKLVPLRRFSVTSLRTSRSAGTPFSIGSSGSRPEARRPIRFPAARRRKLRLSRAGVDRCKNGLHCRWFAGKRSCAAHHPAPRSCRRACPAPHRARQSWSDSSTLYFAGAEPLDRRGSAWTRGHADLPQTATRTATTGTGCYVTN